MTKITREEILKLAELSKLEILDHEIEPLIKQLQDILSYASRVKDIASDVKIEIRQNINVFEADGIVVTPSEPILAQSPDRQDQFFVVPKVLESN